MATLDDVAKKLDEVIYLLKEQNMSPEIWDMTPRDIDTYITLPPGQKLTILELKEEGRLSGFIFLSNNPNIVVRIWMDDQKIDTSIAELYNAGLTSFNPRIPWVSKFDTQNNLYEVVFTPIPWSPYFEKLRVEVEAPKDSPVAFKYSLYRFVKKRR